MKTKDKNIQILIKILEPLLGIRLLKQVFCIILLIFEVDERKIMERLHISYNTIKKYSKLLQEDKLSELFAGNKYRPKSEMDSYLAVTVILRLNIFVNTRNLQFFQN